MSKIRNAPDQKQLLRLLWRAHRAAERAANAALGLNDEGEAYAKRIQGALGKEMEKSWR